MTALKIVRLPHAMGIDLPSYESAQAAGLDLRAALDEGVTMLLQPGMRVLVPTGLVMEIPIGFEAQIRPRSGLAYKNGITCLNSPGTIDADYRGEVMVLLINHGDEPFEIERGMRIAQMVIAPVTRIEIEEATLANPTERGADGFGSTGT